VNIDEMPAGREMNIAVARRVFGLEKDDHAVTCHNCAVAGETYGVEAYSEEIGPAWEVVEKMREHPDVKKTVLRMVVYPYNRTYATFDTEFGTDEGDDNWSEGNGEHHTKLAICRAALKAVA
jgi:hypothetical protein